VYKSLGHDPLPHLEFGNISMAKLSLADMMESQRRPIARVVKTDLSGKTVLITGANTGLGFEAAKHFASMNPAKLIIVCRSQEKGEIASKSTRLPEG
jgi:FlaA1/EpsC-like NDP-sugar epimerase